ncbi:DMP19 family protein [Deinococcus sp. ME38]|uniref:DMP19 family protein n=1 Tax=Deinococcus sp. ME38 TaxID=3400344 RepID=UPI003B5C17A1
MIPALESDLTRLLTAARGFEFHAWVDTLRHRDRHLIVLHTLIASVGNGSFTQWVNFGYRDHQEAVLRVALARFAEHCPAQRAAVTEILALIDQTHRFAPPSFHLLSDEQADDLATLDDRFYALTDDFRTALGEYLLRWQ